MIPRMWCSARTCIHNTDHDPEKIQPCFCTQILKRGMLPAINDKGQCVEFETEEAYKERTRK